MPCTYCKDSAMPGILIPMDFDDREECRDGKVFVAKCDECGLYESDIEAAEVIAKRMGWAVHRSYDRDDEIDPKGRREKQGTDYYRPYLVCTIDEALALHHKES